jgi:Phage terminase, small subunit.
VHGRRLWRSVLSEYDLSSPELALLEVAAHAVDRQLEAEAMIDKEGLTIEGRFGQKAHPAVGIARDAGALLARCLRQLRVELGDEPVQRRPGFRAKPGPKTKLRSVRDVG